jgi:predicted secreted protein
MYRLDPEGVMEQEEYYLKTLQSAENYRLEDGKLQISSGNQVLTFRASEEPLVIPVTPTLYSSISIPIEEFPNHPHIDVVMHAVVGEELTVTLGSNPTTGFQWSEDAEISDESVIKQVSHKFVGPGIDKPPGTPGEEIWTFKGLERGTVTILLEYSRSWIGAGLWAVTITATIR